ncbi:hypothetical protein IFO70_07520 [Phormidium tenue FACHB-886]|nr:hypothetical protein [Phormidium tenue FACHB-886]
MGGTGNAAEGDKIRVYGEASDYRLETGLLRGNFSAIDTAIYKGSDLIAIVQDTNVALSRDFVSARSSIIQ